MTKSVSLYQASLLACACSGLVACSTSNFGSRSNTAQSVPAPPTPSSGDAVVKPAPATDGGMSTSGDKAGTITSSSDGFSSCSQNYRVPATANPWLAGAPLDTVLNYDLSGGGGADPNDTGAKDGPVQVAPLGVGCLTAGQTIYFSVAGSIAHASGLKPTDANGSATEVGQHQKGAVLGLSNIVAPLNSLVGVFLAADEPSAANPPATLDFSTAAARNYTQLSPQLGQVFFIGTGKTQLGAYHQVLVPTGATRLYFAVMDSYQWNNNSGELSGSIMQKAK